MAPKVPKEFPQPKKSSTKTPKSPKKIDFAAARQSNDKEPKDEQLKDEELKDDLDDSEVPPFKESLED
ncbi:unnamed protein product [Penicillium pancosmium]